MMSICDFGKFSLYNERQICYNFCVRTYTFWVIFERAWYSKMMRVMKRNIVIILLLSMIVSMFPAQVLAVEVEPEEKSPVSIAFPDDSTLEKSAEAADNSFPDKTVTAAEVPSAEESVTPEDVAETQDVETAADEPAEDASLLADILTYGNLQYTVNGDNITITGCDEGATSLTIPTQIDGKNVTAIANNAFDGRSSLSRLTIPEGVTSLGYYMIRGTGISSITIPATVSASGNYTSYGAGNNGALAGCTTLNEVVFAQGMTKIPNYICASNAQTSYIKSVAIPDSVQEIGAYAFYKCVALSGQVSISGSVQTIGGSAFSGCTSMSSVKLLDGTQTVGDSAFNGCTGIASVDLAKTVKTVGGSAFAGCTSLASVTTHYNDTVEWSGSMGASAFSGCTSLSSVELAGSIKSLGNELFNGCSALKTLTIPEGVTSLGYYMIRGTGISSITIPATVSASGNYTSYGAGNNGALAGCTTLNEVVFAQGMTKIPNYICASNAQTSYIERVYIPPSVSEVGGYAFYKCDKMTIYCKDGSYAKQYAIDNNIPFILGNFEYGKKPSNSPITTGVIQSVQMTRGGKVYNLLTTKQNFEKNSSEGATVVVTVNWGNAPAGRILLSQKAQKYVQANDGNFGTITPGTLFDTGDYIYAIAVDGNGHTLESKRVMLQVVEPIVEIEPGEQTFKLFDLLEFTVPDDKPVLGNHSFTIDAPYVHMEEEIDGDTFKIAIGAGFYLNEDTGKFSYKDWNWLKGNIKEAGDKIRSGLTESVTYYSLFSKGLLKGAAISMDPNWDVDAFIGGYVEGRIEDGKLIPTEGGIIANAKLEVTKEGQVFIVVVPVYYTIGGGGSVEAYFGVTGMVPGSGFKPMFSGNLEIAPFFEIGGGLGVVYLGQVGARGRATLSINISLNSNYQKVDLSGQAFFEIKALSFTLYERAFPKGTWNIYETGRAKAASLQSTSEDAYATIDMHAPVTPEDRSYSNHPTRWLGETPEASLQATDYTNKELRVLQTNSYPDAKPQIMDVDGTKVMVWVSDNTSRTAMNKSMLVYSVYIDEYDTWSNPRAVMDNGMGDYYPVAKDGYVVWQKASKEFDTSATVAEVSKSMELYIAKFNGTAFDTPARLTNNDIMDAQPQIATNGNSVTLVWTQNTENNILGYTGKNAIYQMTYNGSSWSDATPLVSDLNTIAHLNIGYMGSIPVVAYALDGDNDLNTIADREIYLIRNGSVERFTNNDVIDSNPVFETINGIPALFWYSGDNICYVTDLDTQVLNTVSADGIYQLTDDYSIMSNGNSTVILWTAVQDGVSEVYGALYDGSQWSQDVKITQTGQAARYPDGIIEEDGKLLVSFNRIQNIEDGDYYKDGQADLCVIRVTPSYDLSVSDVFVGDGLAPNTEVPIYFTLKNSGELPLTNVYVDILDVDGSQNSRLDYEGTLQPGESVDLEAVYQTGDSVTAGNIRVQAGTSDGAEYNEDNNTVSVAIGLSDMEVADITDTPDGDTHHVTVAVKNSGYTAASNVNVTISDNAQNIIAHQTLETVSAQATENVSFDIDANSLATENSFITLTVAVSSDTEDANAGNNSQAFTIDKGSQSPTPSNDGYAINNLSVENNVVRVSVTSNTTENAQLWVASYASDGKFLKATSKDITPETVAENPVELSLSTSGAAYVSAFILDSDGNMKPLCPKKSQNL